MRQIAELRVKGKVQLFIQDGVQMVCLCIGAFQLHPGPEHLDAQMVLAVNQQGKALVLGDQEPAHAIRRKVRLDKASFRQGKAVGPADVLHAPIGELMPHRSVFVGRRLIDHLLHLLPSGGIHPLRIRIPRQTARQADARADDNVVLLSRLLIPLMHGGRLLLPTP